MSENKHKKEHKIFAIIYKTIKPTKDTWKAWGIAAIIAIVLSFALGISFKTVTVFNNSVEIINNILLAFVAMVMGAYALFQALLSDELIGLMSEAESDVDENVLNELNSSFLGTVLLYWIFIILNCILLIIMGIIPEEYMICDNIYICNCIAIVLMFLYYVFVFRSIFEFKNFTFNIYNLFRAYNLVGLLRILRKKK